MQVSLGIQELNAHGNVQLGGERQGEKVTDL